MNTEIPKYLQQRIKYAEDGRTLILCEEKYGTYYYLPSLFGGYLNTCLAIFRRRDSEGVYDMDAPVEPTPPAEFHAELLAVKEFADFQIQKHREYKSAVDKYIKSTEVWDVLTRARAGDPVAVSTILEIRRKYEYEGFRTDDLVAPKDPSEVFPAWQAFEILSEDDYERALLLVRILWHAKSGSPDADVLDTMASRIQAYEKPELDRVLGPASPECLAQVSQISSEAQVTFGLSREKYEKIFDMLRENFSWADIARDIGWDEKTLREYYFRKRAADLQDSLGSSTSDFISYIRTMVKDIELVEELKKNEVSDRNRVTFLKACDTRIRVLSKEILDRKQT